MNISIALSLTAVLFALFSPFITSFLNNRHEMKMHKMRFYESHRAEVIENYLQNTGAFISTRDYSQLANYGKSSGEIYHYVPESLWKDIADLHQAISSKQWDVALSKYPPLCQRLAKYNPRSKYK